jgi:hypothetical protein
MPMDPRDPRRRRRIRLPYGTDRNDVTVPGKMQMPESEPGSMNRPPPRDPNVKMGESRFRQFLPPQSFQAANAPPVATATNVPVRVHVRNIGPVLVFFSNVINDLVNTEGPTGAVVRLPPGERDVFYLAPEQTLFSLAAGPGGMCSVAISDDETGGLPHDNGG